MRKLDVGAEQAFAYLVRVSSITNSKLRDVAAEVVNTRQVPILSPSPGRDEADG
jgi:hypothetical protein